MCYMDRLRTRKSQKTSDGGGRRRRLAAYTFGHRERRPLGLESGLALKARRTEGHGLDSAMARPLYVAHGGAFGSGRRQALHIEVSIFTERRVSTVRSH